MPKTIKKSHFEEKICAACGLKFVWRKKWEKNWANVKYCSDRCRSKKSKTSEEKKKLEKAARLAAAKRKREEKKMNDVTVP